MRDYESTDEASAAHLAADEAEPDWDRPTLADEAGDGPWEGPEARCAIGHLRDWRRPLGHQCRCEDADAWTDKPVP